MGSGFSVSWTPLVSQKDPASPESGLGDLPEDCVASILTYLDPPEICRLAKLNRAFHGASSADFVWQPKLPPNYGSVIQRVFSDFPEKSCKKDVYARLCRQNSFDDGTKKVWLDKQTGKVCLSLSSKGLAITGIDDRRYWSRIPTDESRFGVVSYLQQIWWFEVHGEVDFPFPPGTYSVFFRLQLGRATRKFGRRVCNTEHVHGWDVKPVQFQLSTSDGQEAVSQCFLDKHGKWIQYHVGDFLVEGTEALKVKFSMTQIDCTHTKGGVCLDSIVIYPSEFRQRLNLKDLVFL